MCDLGHGADASHQGTVFPHNQVVGIGGRDLRHKEWQEVLLPVLVAKVNLIEASFIQGVV